MSHSVDFDEYDDVDAVFHEVHDNDIVDES